MKFVHYEFAEFENCEPGKYWLIQQQLLAGRFDHGEIFVYDLAVNIRRLADRLYKFVAIGDQSDILSTSQIFHSFAEAAVCRQFMKVGLKRRGSLLTLRRTEVDVRL